MFEDTVERWAPIPGHPGYEASDLGRIRSLDRSMIRSNGWLQRFHGRVLRPGRTTGGHHMVVLNNRRTRSVHQLVLEAFVGPRPEGMYGLHWDDDKNNNRLANLRWATPSENMMDQVRNGMHYEASREECPRGHKLTGANLCIKTANRTKRGTTRTCLACRRADGCIRGIRKRGINVPPDFKTLADQKYAEILAAQPEPFRYAA